MKKPVKILLIVCGTIITLWIACRITGALQYYRFGTPSNSPSIKKGERIFVSNLISPKRLNFIAFRSEDPQLKGQSQIFRVTGIEGDTIEIRNGDLTVNHEPTDKKIRLKHYYFIHSNEIGKLRKLTSLDEEQVSQISPDSVIVCIEDKFIYENQIQGRRFIVPGSQVTIKIICRAFI